MSVLSNWKEVIDTANLSADKEMDIVSRWLIITRSAVVSMTLTSGLIGGLLAAAVAPDPNWLNFGLALAGLAIAHASNNMINDYFDLRSGVDDDAYARALYAPHPVLSGMISQGGLVAAILVANAVDALIMIFLAVNSGWQIVLFAGAGLFISIFYVAPPIRLKHRGLGEPAVFVVWGPLMIGGTYFATAGAWPPSAVWLACVPYGLVVTTVLIGKHIDKIELDAEKGIRTLPVILGERASLRLNMTLMILYYLTVLALVASGMLGIWLLLVALALPRLIEVLGTYRQPKPEEPPEDYPVWPLWFVSAAFYHNKLAGGMFILGLILNLLLPIRIDLL